MIITCGECKHRNKLGICKYFNLNLPEDFFCAAAKRKQFIELKVLSLEEIKTASVLYPEISCDDFSSCIPAKYHDSNNVDMEFYIGESTVSKISLNTEYYNITWRCWNRHPAE